MRFLHTSDWHLGKSLKGRSRIEEHESALLEILDIAQREKVDSVLITGDIFDSQAPPPGRAPGSRPRIYRPARCLPVRYGQVASSNEFRDRRGGSQRRLSVWSVGCAGERVNGVIADAPDTVIPKEAPHRTCCRQILRRRPRNLLSEPGRPSVSPHHVGRGPRRRTLRFPSREFIRPAGGFACRPPHHSITPSLHHSITPSQRRGILHSSTGVDRRRTLPGR